MEFNTVELSNITVLYCEDEKDVREVTADILESFTKKVHTALNGQEGLELYNKFSDEIDLIITDVNMPLVNGLVMAKKIKTSNLHIPIIVTTAFSNSSYLIESIDIGIDKYVIKPIDMKKLFKAMEQCLFYHELQNLYRDNLTGLHNRNSLLKQLKENCNCLLALIDIDDFSLLNELYGESNGDKILFQVSQILKRKFLKESHKIFRVGADKFCVLINQEAHNIDFFINQCEDLAQTIDSQGINLDNGNHVNISITIGIAESDESNAFENAQRVLNIAKDKFIQILVYNPVFHSKPKNFESNLSWIKKLKDGLFDGHFKAYYQPIVDTKTKEIVKYEALIRYEDNNHNIISPDKFLPVAKKAKLYNKILKLMLKEVLEFIQKKQKVVSLNISFDDIKYNESYRFIDKKLLKHKDQCKFLHFEILETEEIENVDIVRNFIGRVQELGCKVGVDDFGAGYSNFSMLQALQIDFVKIDGSLIKNIDTNENQEIIVSSITNYAKRSNLLIIAEFVSNEIIYNKIKSLGIDMAQGWYFGKPLSINHID